MSDIEKLQSLLDEKGIEWWELPDGQHKLIAWVCDGVRYKARFMGKKIVFSLCTEGTVELDFALGLMDFIGDKDQECLLQGVVHDGTNVASQPDDLWCSNCGYSRPYFFWYGKSGYQERQVNYCPHCGMRIFGVVANG